MSKQMANISAINLFIFFETKIVLFTYKYMYVYTSDFYSRLLIHEKDM